MQSFGARLVRMFKRTETREITSCRRVRPDAER
jgi:hypothetical protein